MRLHQGCLRLILFVSLALLSTIVGCMDELHRSVSAKTFAPPISCQAQAAYSLFQIRRQTSFANMAFLRLGCALMLLFYIENACAVRQGHVSEVECKEKLVVTAAKEYFIIEAPTIFESPDPAHPPPLTPSRTQTVNSDPLTRKPLKSVPTRPAHATSPKAAAPKTAAYSRDARV